MMALAVLLLQTLSCFGFGAALLRVLRIDQSFQWVERASWSFVLGMGMLGWLFFFLGVAGQLSSFPMLVLLLAGAPGLVLLGRPETTMGDSWTALERLLIGALLVALLLDCLEGLSPPADADTLAYHFATPKLFWQEGGIFFIPRAVDGAAPMLLQMTYTSALGLGGEKALTLWAMVSGWGAAWMLFVLARNKMSRAWALAITLVWLTTPAVLYGGGSGQVEVRNAGFVLLTIAALMRGRETGWLRYVALAGLAAGLFVATKYTGLLFVAAVGIALLTFNRRPLQIIAFGGMAVLAGFQWYLWNFIHTGDPVFPMLYSLLGGSHYLYWDASHSEALRGDLFLGERAVPNSPLWMLAYPFLATLATSTAFDSERAGMGPFLLLILPFAVGGGWRYRRRVLSSPWLVTLVALSVFYGLWFLSGSSQRVRHLVPVYPVALLVFAYLAVRWTESAKAVWPTCLAVLLTLSVQFAGHGASSINYARHLFAGETRESYYERNVSGWQAVEWINANLTVNDRVLFVNRQLNYLIKVPSYYSHPSNEVGVDTRHTANDPPLFYRQINKLGITHILTARYDQSRPATEAQKRGFGQWRVLLAQGCLLEVGRVTYRHIASRSLATRESSGPQQLILRVDKDACAIR